ncbi:hypothetical protein, partial [Prochlorococcus marinus]
MKLLGLNSPEIFILLVILLSILGPKRIEKGFLLFKKLLKFLLSKDEDQSSANSEVKLEEPEESEVKEEKVESEVKSEEPEESEVKEEKVESEVKSEEPEESEVKEEKVESEVKLEEPEESEVKEEKVES